MVQEHLKIQLLRRSTSTRGWSLVPLGTLEGLAACVSSLGTLGTHLILPEVDKIDADVFMVSPHHWSPITLVFKPH